MLKLHYANGQELAGYLEQSQGHVLGLISFGRQQYPIEPSPILPVDIPVLGGHDYSYEIWTSRKPVVPFEDAGIVGAQDGEVLFASLRIEQLPGEHLERLALRSYAQIFAYLDKSGYRHLLRVWHYFPQINELEEGLERYRCFNVGRHEAFVASGRSIGEETAPAASALGSAGGPLIIYFLAARNAGKAVENPRQIRAYEYPESFGPRSPIFSRAVLAEIGGQSCYFISGTASIAGAETMHAGDVVKQAKETFLNIRTLLKIMPNFDESRLLFKAYLRHSEDMECVRALIEAEFGAGCRGIYLHSNICREDLLVEIECTYL